MIDYIILAVLIILIVLSVVKVRLKKISYFIIDLCIHIALFITIVGKIIYIAILDYVIFTIIGMVLHGLIITTLFIWGIFKVVQLYNHKRTDRNTKKDVMN